MCDAREFGAPRPDSTTFDEKQALKHHGDMGFTPSALKCEVCGKGIIPNINYGMRGMEGTPEYLHELENFNHGHEAKRKV